MSARAALRASVGGVTNTTADAGEPWRWPLNVAAYDRDRGLSPEEARALAVIGDDLRRWPRCRRHASAWRALDRLVRPLADARAVLTSHTRRQDRCADAAVAALLLQCAREHSTFWAWSAATWRRVLGPTQRDFRALHPAWVDRQVRHYLIAVPYVLQCFTDLRPLGNYKRVALAEKVFGRARVQSTIARVAGVLVGWGYQRAGTGRAFPRVLCETLLHNRNPHVEALTPALLAELRRTGGAEKRSLFHQLQVALAALGLMEAPAAAGVARPPVEGVSPRWQAWAARWEATSTLTATTRRHVRLCVLKAGRWLAQEHPIL